MELGANYFLLTIAIRKDFTARLGYIPYPGESLGGLSAVGVLGNGGWDYMDSIICLHFLVYHILQWEKQLKSIYFDMFLAVIRC